MHLLIALLALLAFTAAPLHADPSAHVEFRPDLPAGTACRLDAERLHPTQFALGWREVAHKQRRFGALPAEAVRAQLIEKDVPVVIGPGGVPYLLDGHHTLRALLESTAAEKTAYGRIRANWSDLAPDEFWARMRANGYVNLTAPDGGGPLPPAQLPASLRAMARDPYRGLAWAVMHRTGFAERKDVLYLEFLWADFFRRHLAWDDNDDDAFDDAATAAMVLARSPAAAHLPGYTPALRPRVVTETVRHDTDDPAIWIDRADPARSLVLGTDKDTDGALYAFDLRGRVVRSVPGLRRPNNVDLATGIALGGRTVDLAVVTEREAKRLRVFTLPDLAPADRGDLVVFDGDEARAPMGIALYRRPRDGALFAIVGGKSGPAEGYLAQYRLEDDGTGHLKQTLVRTFGRYSGRKEIEALAVDAELGYVYCSDEQFGVRKYHADPDAPDAGRELALFGTDGFAADHEGISFYKRADGTGYIVVSDQQADAFRIFPREGTPADPHAHPFLARVFLATSESDGSELASESLPGFPGGLFVAMSTDRTFHYYAWDDIARAAGLAAAEEKPLR